jgi:catechol 2,3-dioxygenase-like lactoylglutathione lyase family enzyme
MESFRESIKEVTALFHMGAAVSDLHATIAILEKHFNFTEISHRRVEHEYIGRLINVPDASAEIAFLDIGDSNIIELISWDNHSSNPVDGNQHSLSSVGIHHICIYVDKADEWHHKLSTVLGVRVLSDSPIVVPIGPNKGCKVFFVLVLNELYFEIFERVSDLEEQQIKE